MSSMGIQSPNRRLRQTFVGEKLQFMRPVIMEVHGLEGQPLTLILRDELGHVAQVSSSMPLARAEKQPLSTERLTEQFGRLAVMALAVKAADVAKQGAHAGTSGKRIP